MADRSPASRLPCQGRGRRQGLMAGVVAAGMVVGLAGSAFAAADAIVPATPASPELGSTLPGIYLSARVAQATRDLPSAAAFLAAVLKDQPDDTALQNRAFLVSMALGRVGDALGYAKALGETGGTARLPALVLSLDDAKAGRFAEVERRAQTLPAETMQRTVGALMTAWARAGAGRTADAVSALDPLGRTAELVPLQNLHAGMIQELGGDNAAAEASYRRAMDQQNGTSFRVTDALGRLLERTGRAAEARKLYQTQGGLELAAAAIRRIDQGQTPEPLAKTARDGFAQMMFDLASIANQPDTTDLALVYGWLALDMKPDFPTAKMLVAEILENEDRLADAQQLYAGVPKDSALGWLARLRGAELTDRLGDADKATAEFQALAEEQKDRPEPLVALGDQLRGHEKFAEAAAAYDRAIARIPTMQPQNWPLLYSRGISLERSGQWPRAEADFDEALVLAPDQPSVLNYLGYSWIEQGRKLTAALRLVERAVQQRPDDGSIVDSLGWGFYRLNQLDKAAAFMERAVELRPQDSTINAHYGDVLWAFGRHREARFQWSHALTYNPDADQIPILKARLIDGLPAEAAKPAADGTATPAPAPAPAPQPPTSNQKPGRGG